MHSHDRGFTLVELLIAAALLAVAMTAIITHTVQLGEINSRAEAQSVASSIAEAVAARYAHAPPAPGTSVSSDVGANMEIPGLTEDQQRLIGRYRYTLTAHANGSFTIHVQQGDDDPYALNLTTTPPPSASGGAASPAPSTGSSPLPPAAPPPPPASPSEPPPIVTPPPSTLPTLPPVTTPPLPTTPVEGPVSE